MWFLEMLRNNVDLKHCCVFSSYTFPLPVDCQETWGWSHLCGEHHVTETWVLGKTSKLQFQFSEKRDSLSRNPKASYSIVWTNISIILPWWAENHLPISASTSIPWEKHLLLLFRHSVMPDSLQPHGLWHARLPCPLPSTRVHSNSCLTSWWCHPTISSSVIPSSSCL